MTTLISLEVLGAYTSNRSATNHNQTYIVSSSNSIFLCLIRMFRKYFYICRGRETAIWAVTKTLLGD